LKIGILGSAFSFHQAPFDDPSWELWACNIGTVPRWDRWFDLHDDASIDTYPGHREFLTSQTKPVYTRQNYPIAAMTEKYGTWFFTSSIAYMLAMALEEKPEEIGLWGVDMADASEYTHQKAGCRFFIQTARMAGIRVTMPPECEVAAPGRLYSLEPPSWIGMKAAARKAELLAQRDKNEGRKHLLVMEKSALMGRQKITLTDAQIEARLAQVSADLEQSERAGLVIDGALQDIQHILTNWAGE
jgi:hypothetical protein